MNVRTLSEAMIDAILADSFPASDPPPWTIGRDAPSFSKTGSDSVKKMGIPDPSPAEKEAEGQGQSSHLEMGDV